MYLKSMAESSVPSPTEIALAPAAEAAAPAEADGGRLSEDHRPVPGPAPPAAPLRAGVFKGVAVGDALARRDARARGLAAGRSC